jgi:serine/threonine protein phosphatase 1
LVVGDLHGHRSLLEDELVRLRFDPLCDRVFSVGDLIDRGPDSLATLSLIQEPWFYAVLGNHELMLLNYLQCYSSRMHARKSYASGSSEWVVEAMLTQSKSLTKLIKRLAQLPLAIQVDGDVPFYVTHSDLPPVGTKSEGICMHKADRVTSSRDKINLARKAELLELKYGEHDVQISARPVTDPHLTYAGHSPVRSVTVHHSYVFIDQGVCTGTSKRSAHTPPTVLDHRKFAHWLKGVATAQRGTDPGASRRIDDDQIADRVPAFLCGD